MRPGSGLIPYSGALTCEFLGALFAKYPTFRDWSIVFTYANHSGNKQNDKTAALPEGLQLRTAPAAAHGTIHDRGGTAEEGCVRSHALLPSTAAADWPNAHGVCAIEADGWTEPS